MFCVSKVIRGRETFENRWVVVQEMNECVYMNLGESIFILRYNEVGEGGREFCCKTRFSLVWVCSRVAAMLVSNITFQLF